MIEVLVSEKLVVRVPCAVIERDGKVLAGQRSAALSFPLQWEFPGGKLEKGETDEQALFREIMEELNVAIEIVDPASMPTGGQVHRAIQGEQFDAEQYDRERAQRYRQRVGFY